MLLGIDFHELIGPIGMELIDELHLYISNGLIDLPFNIWLEAFSLDVKLCEKRRGFCSLQHRFALLRNHLLANLLYVCLSKIEIGEFQSLLEVTSKIFVLLLEGYFTTVWSANDLSE